MSHASADAATYPPAELDRRFYAFTVDRLVAWGVYAAASYAASRPARVSLSVIRQPAA